MIEHIASDTRKLLIECRCLAMRDGIKISIAKLDDAVEKLGDQDKLLDTITLQLLKAELLYLDDKVAESLKAF